MAKNRKEQKELKSLIEQQLKYSSDVEEYLKTKNPKFLDNFVELCQNTNGRITYLQIQEILVKNPPIAGWIDKNDRKNQIVAFLSELGIPFKVTENHVYFP